MLMACKLGNKHFGRLVDRLTPFSEGKISDNSGQPKQADVKLGGAWPTFELSILWKKKRFPLGAGKQSFVLTCANALGLLT